MENTSVIVALDVDRRRLTALANQLERCRVKNAIVYELDARRASELSLKFDRILLDAPCSGNFAADRNWFRRRTIKDVQRNAAVQREMLTECEKILKPDGELVYSTCSLEPEEDELNVDWAVTKLNLQTEPICCYGQKGLTKVFGRELDPSVENSMRIWPGQTQGFFVCEFRRRPKA
jgi:16S rRNA C967 or C1407 C5-methylase (RsmB/RsmF family)